MSEGGNYGVFGSAEGGVHDTTDPQAAVVVAEEWLRWQFYSVIIVKNGR